MPTLKIIDTDKLEAVFKRLPPETTNASIARKMGMSDVTVHHYRKGNRQPSGVSLILFAAALGVDPGEIMTTECIEFYDRFRSVGGLPPFREAA